MRPLENLPSAPWTDLLPLRYEAPQSPDCGQRYDDFSAEDTIDMAPLEFETSIQTETMRIEHFGYASLAQLRQALAQIDQPRSAHALTVIVILDERFCGHLPSLIARKHPAMRLVLASTSGRLPGLSTVADLSAASGALGWRQITFSRTPEQAVVDVTASMADGERAVVCYPNWTASER